MKPLSKILLNISTLVLISCSSASPLESFVLLRDPENLNHSISFDQKAEKGYVEFKNKIKEFAEKLSAIYSRNNFHDNNLVISPISIELCLGLAIRSANNTTRQELLDIFDVDYVTFNKYYKYIYNELVYSSFYQYDGQLSFYNSFWFDNNLSLIEDGLDGLRDDYYCYSYQVDFDGKNAKTNQAIQQFIREKTNNLIDPQLNFSEETLFILMNTLYLKDAWSLDIDALPYDNQHQFTNIDGTISDKKLLRGLYSAGRAINTEQFSAFKSQAVSTKLYFIKPNDGYRIQDVFTKENISYVTNYQNYVYTNSDLLERYHTNCIFPEFVADANIDLAKMFANDFHVKTLFGNGCDFSNITKDPAFCKNFRQLVKLDVNKRGIEGAAVTYMETCGSAGPNEYTDVYESFIIDKEFGFLITRNDMILFSGIISNIDK